MINQNIPTNKTKVAFFGTSDRSVKLLEQLKANFDLVLCVTKADVKFGRKQILKETGVKTWAKQNSIKFNEIHSFDADTKANIVEQLMNSDALVSIVADFSFMLPEEVIHTPKLGSINIHFSKLPKYRGASPVQFTILNGDTHAGVTFYLMDKGMDTGKILYQFEYELKHTETSEELYETLFLQSAKKLPFVLENYINGTLKPIPQIETMASYTTSKSHPKNTFIYKEDARIDWNSSTRDVEREIRAYYSWPVAWTTLGEMQENMSKIENMLQLNPDVNTALKVKLHKATLNPTKQLRILQLQVEGKDKLSWKEFENGYLAKKSKN